MGFAQFCRRMTYNTRQVSILSFRSGGSRIEIRTARDFAVGFAVNLKSSFDILFLRVSHKTLASLSTPPQKCSENCTTGFRSHDGDGTYRRKRSERWVNDDLLRHQEIL